MLSESQSKINSKILKYKFTKPSMTDSKNTKKMAEQLTLDPAKPINEQKKDSFFRSFLQKFYKEIPETLPSAQALESFKFAELDFHTEKGKKMLYTIFRRHGLTFKFVKTKAAIAIPEIDFRFNSDKERTVISMFLKNLHPSSGLLQLTAILRDVYMDTTAFGTGYLDPVWNKKKQMIINLKKPHPISIDLIRDDGFGEGGKVKLTKKGNPLGWISRVENKEKRISFAKLSYLTFVTIGDEWLGVSDLEPIYQTVWRLMNIEEGIATAIFRHGFPLYDIKVSGASEGRPPTKEQLEEAANEVKGLNYKSEFVHGPNYTIKLLEAFSMGKSQDYVEPFVDQIVAASDLPKYILIGNAEGLSKNSASELNRFIKPLLKPSQDKLKLFFEEQILKPLMEANNIDTVPQLIIKNIPILESETEDEDETEDTDTETNTEEKLEAKIDGLNLANGKSLMTEETKQLAVSSKEEKEMKKFIGKKTNIYEDNKLVGKIKLRKPRKINLNEFIVLEYAHKIEGDEREIRWPGETEFLVYEFDIIKEEEE